MSANTSTYSHIFHTFQTHSHGHTYNYRHNLRELAPCYSLPIPKPLCLHKSLLRMEDSTRLSKRWFISLMFKFNHHYLGKKKLSFFTTEFHCLSLTIILGLQHTCLQKKSCCSSWKLRGWHFETHFWCHRLLNNCNYLVLGIVFLHCLWILKTTYFSFRQEEFCWHSWSQTKLNLLLKIVQDTDWDFSEI